MSEYPKMLYAGDGRTIIAGDADEESAAKADGFGNDPSGFYALANGAAAVLPAPDDPTPPAGQSLINIPVSPDRPRRGRPRRRRRGS